MKEVWYCLEYEMTEAFFPDFKCKYYNSKEELLKHHPVLENAPHLITSKMVKD